MLKRIATLIIILIFIPIYLSAQVENKYLVAVDLDHHVNLNTLEKLELSVYHIFKETLIAEASDQKIRHLRRSGISYRVLDENPENSRYSIVSSKRAEEIRLQINDQIIYDDGESFIIKNRQQEVEKLTTRGLFFAEMSKTPMLFKSEKIISQYQSSAILDSVISNILLEIDVDSVRYFIQSLQDFGTRFLLADTRDAVADWIQSRFEKMGYTDVILDEFWNMSTNTWQKNVIATFPGSKDPDNVFVIGGHHDSVTGTDPMVFAPGADDNASGTAAVLEIARAISESGYQPEATFIFMTFAAEEYGLFGSEDFAEKAFNSNMNIKLMINHDMISHTLSSVEQSDVDINFYTGSENFSELAKISTNNYTIINPTNGTQNSAGSDSYSFWRFGFPAVYFEERNFSPYYHSNQDVIENYSMEYCTEVIKASCATLISASVIPSKVEKFDIVDMGDGNALQLSWASNPESDVTGYNIYLGTSSGIYDTIYTTTDTSLFIDDLMAETIYYVGITAYDLNLFESTIVEKFAVPRIVPMAPVSVYAEPVWHAIELHWSPNLEYDISGYNIYRSTDLSESLVRVNESTIEDTSYTDNTAENAVFYYYVITAVDNSQYESIESDTIKSRNVSLDQGIIVVDETSDGNGLIFNPTDDEVDNFYNSVLVKFKRYEFDVLNEDGINLADFGAYSTIIWHGNDYLDLDLPLEIKNDLKKYLDYGGNFLYTGYLPSKAFEGNIAYEADYSTGDFIYDYLKIQHVETVFGSRFNGAIPVSDNYQEIYTDSSKTKPSMNYHLRSIEGIEPAPGGNSIYLYDTDFDTSTVQGSMKDQTVGVTYFGDDFKAVTLSFPLYYMNLNESKALIEYLLLNKFNEVVSIDESEQYFLPENIVLHQNYPNPFNPTTIINYELPITNIVELSIYNLLGQKVVTLVSEKQMAGNHQIQWDAAGFASGIYYYKIMAGEFQDVKKMILLR